jgi:hypothetical protein
MAVRNVLACDQCGKEESAPLGQVPDNWLACGLINVSPLAEFCSWACLAAYADLLAHDPELS